MAPPPQFGANSVAARDIANVLHPYTDLEAHQQAGPVVISHGKGVRVWDEVRQGIHRIRRWPMVRRARF